MTAVATAKIELACRRWLEDWVIGHNLCPFAKQPLVAGRVSFSVVSTESNDWLSQFIDWLLFLAEHPAIETALYIAPELDDFEQYLGVVEQFEQVLDLGGWRGQFQLATFHPEYLFADTEEDDPSHFTNRSPYPMFHLLREQSLTEALATYRHPERIPERNIEKMQQLGAEHCARALKNYKTD
ncbi:DUF1415 domain-containing protein [Idiomarina tyrosinivorans]|uniref:DUF1415 domain-containing protein n=1 Tax=Idiomarina tyrosinivorans TaxID=1445662 RepID=A0A432ZR66_9GAMM|nr:DUF1415 domain-containing protein [Idiomarina tyrosinivorans]RUO80397.1 DUF1415 domain-containing protein [Idiomarina tyrosinivorans]